MPRPSPHHHETTFIRGSHTTDLIQVIAMRLQRLPLSSHLSLLASLPNPEPGEAVTLDRSKGDSLDDLRSDRSQQESG